VYTLGWRFLNMLSAMCEVADRIEGMAELVLPEPIEMIVLPPIVSGTATAVKAGVRVSADVLP
jgi:hypothetical protein